MLKIGILIRDFESLRNYELRIINNIIDDENLKLSLLIKDGRKNVKNSHSKKNILLKILSSISLIGKALFDFQCKIENRLYPEKVTVNKEEIINHLHKIPCVNLNPKRTGFFDVFSIKDSEMIREHNLDIILQHEFNNIRGNILESSKYGIWSFHYEDKPINSGVPAGFWEIILKKPSVGITLQKLTSERDGELIIDKTNSNKTRSFVLTNRKILEDSVSLLFKNLKKLKNGDYSPAKSKTYNNPIFKSPDLNNTVKYIFGFYFEILMRQIRKIEKKIFNVRYSCWTLFIGKGVFIESTLFGLKPVNLPKNEFWADPFLFEYKYNHYVFFENYSYLSGKGKISCGRIEKDTVVEICDVLDLDYHLSYPFICKENGEIYLIPDTHENKRLEVYKCIEFPNNWELFSTAFEGEIVFDAHFYQDNKNQKWLFINKSSETTSFDNELYVYRVDSLKLEKIEEHKQNPVIINSKSARNGGSIFKFENEFFRPSQYNADGIYGRGLNINKITKLSLEEYEEENILRVMPNFHKGLIGTHHLHQTEDLFVIDACFRKK
ncbi:glucosamine inositolphosphorylceramide transferase family protein [Lentiprolixibacter aurantiacus]|uniref:Glucosamine inositolphosphorylceramide transferase 1 N-terminal domain-containing protein n=1 Tax=Lentiprolixibacter aurantiacus TaxID=2993939 RepID=A0AAE3MI27_9FLAO|nr:hypothetical protein [Lentiprolixibacter aurantiacus]MCX2718055.1 hypothetical protein [Lentiprolixibacter aurantiacus]